MGIEKIDGRLKPLGSAVGTREPDGNAEATGIPLGIPVPNSHPTVGAMKAMRASRGIGESVR